MEILYRLEQLRTPLGERIFGIITCLGSDIMLIATLCALLWICGRRAALRLAIAYAASGMLNQLLKVIFAVPRPWVRDSRLTPAPSAVAGATGYSLPSGHSQTAACLFTTLMLLLRRRWVWFAGGAAIAAVMFSRLYLGVHTPLDVVSGCALSTATTLLINRLLTRAEHSPHYMRGVLLGGGGGALAMAVMLALKYASGTPAAMLNDIAMVAGGVLGFVLGLSRDARREEALLPYRLSVPLAALGLAVVFALKLLLGAALKSTPGALWQTGAQYAMITYYIAGVHPALMRAAGRRFLGTRDNAEV